MKYFWKASIAMAGISGAMFPPEVLPFWPILAGGTWGICGSLLDLYLEERGL